MKKNQSAITVDYLNKKLDHFTNKLNFKEIIILGTGPSLDEGVQYLKEKKDKKNILIISLKQSYLKVNNYGYKLIHLTNPWNFQKYKYSKENVFKIYFHEYFAKFRPNKENYDLFFFNENIKNPIKNSVLAKSLFSKYLYDNKKTFSEIRPVMPGIFGEALYLAIFIGCKELKLFGVDYSYNSKDKKDHYFNLPSFFESFLKLITKLKLIQKLFFKLGLRTQYSIAFDEEMEVAIPGYSKFIEYIVDKHDIEVDGWKY